MATCIKKVVKSASSSSSSSFVTKHKHNLIKLGDLSEKNNNDAEVKDKIVEESSKSRHKLEIAWRSTLLLTGIHLLSLYGAGHWVMGHYYGSSFFIQWVFGMMSALGTTAGAHRLWAHRSYKATLPLKIFLALCQTISCQVKVGMKIVACR